MKFEITMRVKPNTGFDRNLANPAPLMQDISLRALSAIQHNIETNIGPQNAPLTTEVKRGSNTLRDRGGLRGSLTARHSADDAIVGTNHPAAEINNPADGRSETVIRPKNAKYLCIPAGPQTRKFQRTYGFSVREVLDGLRGAGYAVYRPMKRSVAIPANIIMAQKGTGAPVAIFILKKKIVVPVRRFMYLSEDTLREIEARIEVYFGPQK